MEPTSTTTAKTPSTVEKALAFFGLSPRPSPRLAARTPPSTFSTKNASHLNSPRVRRSARLRGRSHDVLGEETEVQVEYFGEVIPGGGYHFFGEHETIQGNFLVIQ